MRMRKRVRARRIERGLSQAELSRRTGLHRFTIRLIERDTGYAPTGAVQLRLAEALGRGTHELFWSEPDNAPLPATVS